MSTIPTDRVVLETWPTPMQPAPRLAVAIGLDPEDLWLKRDDLTGLGAGGNLLLDGILGASIIWTGNGSYGEEFLRAVAEDAAQRLRHEGRHPVIIPFGGSNVVGAHGYRVAGHEILEQCPELDHVVCAVGSGGTMAGLVAALGVARVLGVHAGAVSDPYARVVELLTDMGEPVTSEALRIRTDQVGPGDDSLTAMAGHALRTAARTEGLILDPTYTARALAGLITEISDCKIGAGEKVAFLASGGLPGLFGHAAATTLAI